MIKKHPLIEMYLRHIKNLIIGINNPMKLHGTIKYSRFGNLST